MTQNAAAFEEPIVTREGKLKSRLFPHNEKAGALVNF